MHIVSFAMMNIHHQNGEVSSVKGFMLADSTGIKRQDFIVILFLLLMNIIIITIVTVIFMCRCHDYHYRYHYHC